MISRPVFIMIILFIIALVMTWLVYNPILAIAKEKNLVDNPNARKLQKSPVPVLGGVAVFFGIVIGLCFFKTTVNHVNIFSTLCAMMIMLYVGTMDDIRKGSPTYGRHVAVELSEENHRQCFIARGLAHGFAVLSDMAVFQYKCDEFYHPEADGGISILDDSLGIDWRISTESAMLSTKDTLHPLLKDFDSPFAIDQELY